MWRPSSGAHLLPFLRCIEEWNCSVVCCRPALSSTSGGCTTHFNVTTRVSTRFILWVSHAIHRLLTKTTNEGAVAGRSPTIDTLRIETREESLAVSRARRRHSGSSRIDDSGRSVYRCMSVLLEWVKGMGASRTGCKEGELGTSRLFFPFLILI